MEQYKISIIIPVYQVEKYIDRCLESVCSQTYQNLRIIIVNDGSKDKSMQIAERYAAADNRIIICNKENGGLSSARNEGLKYAEGEFCYFLDSDDYIEKHAVQRMIQLARDHQADLVAFGNDYYDDDNNHWEYEYLEDAVYPIVTTQDRIHFLGEIYYNYKIRFEVWNKLFRLPIIQEKRLWFENNYEVFAEDVCFLSYYLMYVQKAVSVRDILHHYLIRQDSITAAARKSTKIPNFCRLVLLTDQFIENRQLDINLRNAYQMLAFQLLHDRFKWVKLNVVCSEIRKLNSLDEKSYLRKSAQYILQHRQDVLAFYQQKQFDSRLAYCIVEEAGLCYRYSQPVGQFFYLLRILVRRIFRYVSRKLKALRTKENLNNWKK